MKRALICLLLALCLFALSACDGTKTATPEDDRVVLTLSDEKIYYDYFRYAYLHLRDDLSMGDSTYWESNEEAETLLKEETLSFLLRNRAIQLLAEDYDIALSKAEKEEIDEYIKSAAEQYGSEEAYLAELEATYLTAYTLTYLERFNQIWTQVYLHVTDETSGVLRCDDATVEADIPVNFRRIQYIYLQKDHEHPETSAALAEEVLGYAVGGQDFKKLIRDYGEDNTMLTKIEDGYYYTLLSIDKIVEAAVEQLDEGGISGVIEVSHGYYIVQRLPLDDAYIENNFEEFRAGYKARMFELMIEEKMKTIEVEYSDLWQTVSTATVK